MNKEELIKKITEKKEFSQLPKKDVEMAFNKFDKTKYIDEEKESLQMRLQGYPYCYPYAKGRYTHCTSCRNNFRQAFKNKKI
jgi:hypothetical protein